ncbi:hypothetical protein HDU76_005249 [Blyttiomyces sp. JEL0837]|nr:hypothetical protein HDU76_005249 [Blyttiomyces sp. JEL0837]
MTKLQPEIRYLGMKFIEVFQDFFQLEGLIGSVNIVSCGYTHGNAFEKLGFVDPVDYNVYDVVNDDGIDVVLARFIDWMNGEMDGNNTDGNKKQPNGFYICHHDKI